MTVWPDHPGTMAGFIRRHDWASTALGPLAGWPRKLRFAVELMLDAPGPAAVAWGPDFSVLFNDGFAALLGATASAALGRPFAEVWGDPETDDIVASLRAGTARSTTDRFMAVPQRLRQPEGWFSASWTPLRGEAGAVLGFYLTAVETTDRVVAERTLREREAQQAYLLQLSDALRALADSAAIQGEACRLLGERLGADHAYYIEIDEAEGRAVIERDYARDGLPSLAGTCSLAALDRVLALYRAGRPIAIPDMRETALVREPEQIGFRADRVVACVAVPLVMRGALVGALVVLKGEAHAWSDAEVALAAGTGERIWAAVTRARAESRAREADARLRTMADAAPVLIWDVDAAGTVFVNEHYLAFFGTSFETIAEGGWAQFLHPEDAEGYLAAYGEAFVRRRSFVHEARVRRADGEYRWLSHSGRPLGADRYVGISIDVTERHRAQERLKRNNALLGAINRIFGATLGAASEEELARVALEVAGDLTDSAVGFMGATDARTGRLDTLATIERPPVPGTALRERAATLERAIRDAPAAASDSAGSDRAAEARDAVLRVPLTLDREVVGVIGLAGRVGGYGPEERAMAEALAPAIRHALLEKRAEAGLRESEARFRQFAQASSDVLWMANAETLASEFVSPALTAVYGVSPEAMLGDVRNWAAHVVPDDRAATMAQFERVRSGVSVVHEFRILRPSDRAFRWIRTHCFPLFDEEGRLCRLGGITSDVTEMRQAEQHQQVLVAELQHRVRNIMALIRSIVVRSGQRAESVGDYAAQVGGRLVTLARVQSRLTRAPSAGVSIPAILRDEIGAQAECENQYELVGAEIELAPKAAEVLTLAVHELTTNALKHGALSNGQGRVCVRWHGVERKDGPWLSFLWTETGGPAPQADDGSVPRRRGFGSELIEGMIPYELGGTGRIELTPEGARCQLEFPLVGGPSILETHAPRRASVFGGSLDLAGEVDLHGQTILLAEDEFYLANDTARAFEGVGAAVLGPCVTEAAALDCLARHAPTGAVIDINLGGRPSFALARALADRGIPVVFVTGDEPETIPAEFAQLPRLEKPVELRRIVDTLARTLRADAPRVLNRA